MKEDEPRTGLLAVVRAEILRLDLGCYHTGISIGSDEGFPDLTIWGPGGLIFRELKGTHGQLYVTQLDVILGLRRAGQDAAVWWAEEWHIGLVRTELERLSGMPPRERTPVFRPGFRRCGCHIDFDHTCNVWGATR